MAKPLPAQRYESVPVQPARTTQPAPDAEEAAAKLRRPAATWPLAGVADVSLSINSPTHAAAPPTVRAGALPVTVRAMGTGAVERSASVPRKVRVETLPQAKAEAAGFRGGLLVRVGRVDGAISPGQIEVAVDYSTFASAYGADWSSRLRLVRVPECALTSPGAPTCSVEPLKSHNNMRTRTVSAPVTVAAVRPKLSASEAKRLEVSATAASAGTMLALTAGATSGAGNLGASSLAPSSSWSHGGSSGGFQWSYPMRTPPGPGGPSPSLGLGYASQSVDGRHAATNNQPGPIGEGFDYSPGFIERQYKPCADDMGGTANNTVKTGDLCWGPANAVLSLGGSSMELLKGTDGKWHPRTENGSKIELLTTPTYPNGDNDNEYWKVTTADGTRYWFGRHQLPGWSAGRPVTNSVLTVPVYGNNPGEPCNAATFAASECQGKRQAWRWNLDYVEDVHGNTMSLWWAKETNYYAQNNVTTAPKVYDRAGHLLRIDYGTDNRDNNEYGATSPYVENAPARVEFTNSDRCLANCTTKNSTTWPDTPWDQECLATTNPCRYGTPTFWSGKRTTVITTKVWKAATSSYQPVDSWTLRHSFLDPGDGTRAGLWLEGITHRGLNGTAVVSPEVTFSGIQMQNRVDASGADWALAMNWWRVNSIKLETGGEIFVTYSPPQCAGGTMPSESALDSNTLRCYPVRWTPPAYTDPITDYFHKYVVTEVQQIDHTGGSRPVRTAYEYGNSGNQPLWHHDEDTGLVPANRRTWSQWRGYPTVITYVGEGAARTKTETLYFRGMYGDKLASGGTRTTTVQGREGGATNDYDHYAGMPREQLVWRGATIISASLNEMWRSDPPTATRAGTPAAESRYARVRTARTRTTTDTGIRRTATVTSYDSYGMPTSVDDEGDSGKTGDERCLKTEYARNTANGNWLLTPVKRTHGWAGTCATAPVSKSQITGDTRFSFDAQAYGVAPTAGLVTTTEVIFDFDGTARSYQLTSTGTYDSAGRVKTATDIAGETTKTDYTPASGGPVTKVVTTNPLDWTNTVELDPALGLPLKSTDQNGRYTEYGYDAIGRTTAVWLPGRPKANYLSTPSVTYAYNLSKSAPSSVTTNTLNANGGYNTSHLLIDALGRPRQTQEPGYNSGRILTDTFYDAAGRTYKTNSAYWNKDPVNTSALFFGYDQDVPSQTQILFDGAGRPTASILFGSKDTTQVEKTRTTTEYHGDHVTVLPDEGEAASTAWKDARGRTERMWQYHGRTATGSFDETRYAYHPSGELAVVTDPSGNTWSYNYDLQGRLVGVSDPDKGDAEFSYNSLWQLQKTVDSRAETPDLYYAYDRLGRLKTVTEGSLTGPKRVEYAFDSPVKGMTSSASRWIGADEYRDEVVSVDAQYRPTQTKLTLPASQVSFCGATATTCSFTSKATYKANGAPSTVTLPAAGGLNQEVLSYEYDTANSMPNILRTNYGDLTHYVVQSNYTSLFELSSTVRASALVGAPFVQSKQDYDAATGRVASSVIFRSTAPSYVSIASYDYDASGNLRKIDDNPGSRPRDTQCFRYDHQRRLTKAWTPSSPDCDSDPTAVSQLGGPAPYWQEWSFGAPDDSKGRVGNRLGMTEYGTPTGTVTTSYEHNEPGADLPHAVKGWSRTDDIGTTTGSYNYDAAGNMISRPGSSGQQSMTWDAEGHLATLTDSAGENSYIYAADGSRLIANDPTGSTLFLGDTEVRRNATTGSLDATRYYTFNDETVAQRTVTGVTWLASDHQGTAQVSVGTDANQTVIQRRHDPFGVPRGESVSWVNKQGFLGGYQDPTGLTHLGAREYDPKIGRFISVDPVNDPGNPQQMHAYAYAHNNPVTFSDPSGEIIEEYDDPDPPDGFGGMLIGCSAANVKGYACQNLTEGTHGLGEGESSSGGGGSGGKTPWRTKSERAHMLLDGCGWTVVGPACDMVNFVLYVKEKDYINAAQSVPIFGKACKIKVVCEAAVQKLIGKAPPGKVAKTDDAAKLADDAAGATRARGGDTLPDPKLPEPPNKSPVSKTKGKSEGAGGGWPPNSQRGGCKHSFDPSTPVLMADGSTRPIGEVQQGDKVLAHDPETGATTAQAVEASHVNQDEDLTDLYVRTADGKFVTVKTTQHHPFWSDSRNEWVDAADLQPTEWLKTATGVVVTVAEVHNFRGQQTMRDLTVSDVHTYYVIAGKTPVLVHNCGDGVPSHKNLPSRNAAFREAKRDLGIPMSQQPLEIQSVPMTNRDGMQIMNGQGRPVMTREYIFVRGGGERVVIQDHSFGHQFGEGGVGDQGRHLNVRPWSNTRTGKVPGTAQHYEY
ncbi:HNH/endonuclease VII fold putative polymorphic toxin [Micromonospora purpureochromogenes]|uniref:HNH/endonuclease VII fold putative polymorphic toxin n=1 Tax=Micromonospora purpureochromogenes TaxID=47872 RepID=UPI00340697EE